MPNPRTRITQSGVHYVQQHMQDGRKIYNAAVHHRVLNQSITTNTTRHNGQRASSAPAFRLLGSWLRCRL